MTYAIPFVVTGLVLMLVAFLYWIITVGWRASEITNPAEKRAACLRMVNELEE